ncbi:MAG: hypothetical protein HOV81_29810 [Kofleriaceae bacterium]|nr:hypothetical protein [Kofleriaceae bacterium]
MNFGPPSELEAKWTENGASCLNTPRLVANPPQTVYPQYDGISRTSIVRACGWRMPTCGTLNLFNPPLGTHLISSNP